MNRNDTERCSICLNPLKSSKNMTTRFSCGHEFHEKCIRNWNRSKRTVIQKTTCPLCRNPISNQMRNEMKQRAQDVLATRNRLIKSMMKTYRHLQTGSSDVSVRFQLMTFGKKESKKKSDINLDELLRQKFDPVFHFVMETSDPSEDTPEVKQFVDTLFTFLKTFVFFLKHLDESLNLTHTKTVLVRYPVVKYNIAGYRDIMKDPFLIYINKHVLKKWIQMSVFDVLKRMRLPEKVNEIRKWYAPLHINL